VTLVLSPSSRGWIDTTAIKQANPIEVVAARYGIDLRPQGRAWIGRCPFHADRGRPNFYAYESQSWRCYRCGVGGDVLDFVMRAEQVGFREAVERLGGASALPRRLQRAAEARPAATACGRDADELAVLRAAASLYHHRLRAEPRALAYLERRGIDRATIEQYRVGYAAGDALIPYLRWRGLPISAALRVGLLNRAGWEHFAGRIVVPELSAGQPIWLVGRLLEQVPAADDQPAESNESSTPVESTPVESTPVEDEAPRYLMLPGPKPLLGWEHACGSASVCVVEGVFDLLTLRMWGYPVVALLGSHTRPDLLDRLRTFARSYLILDNDDAGLEATLKLVQELGSAAVPVALPDGIKDVAELAARPDGQSVFAAALMDSVGAGALVGA
jgi:DNA primase